MEGKLLHICHVEVKISPILWLMIMFVCVWLRHDAAENIGLMTFPTRPSSFSKVKTVSLILLTQ